MSKHMAKAALRTAKNYTMGFSDIQVKVREATSNDPWGPSGSQMAEIAEATYRGTDFMEIMDMVDKRLNDSGKNWRHVFKALILLDYMIHCGSEQVVAYAKQNLYVIKTLKEFQYIDDDGKDQGANIREKSKALASLLADEDRLQEERKQRNAMKDRMATGSAFGVSGVRPNDSTAAPRSTANMTDEERDLQRAIEESKRTAQEHERRQKEKEREELELRKALDASKTEHHQVQQQKVTNNAVDLWGPDTSQQKHDLDFFASMAAPAAVQQSQPDPFGFSQNPAPIQSQQMNLFAASSSTSAAMQSTQMGGYGGGNNNANPFAAASANPFGAQSMAFGQPQQQQQQMPPMFPTQTAYQSGPAYGNAQQSMPFQTGGFGQQQQQPSASAQFSPSFDAAFDQGNGQKNLVPRHLQNPSNPNAQLAQIARNASQIDPFANLANKPVAAKTSMTDLSGRGSGFGLNNNTNAAAQYTMAANPMTAPVYNQSAQMPNYQPSYTAMSANTAGARPPNQQSYTAGPATNDPFASLVSFGGKPAGNGGKPGTQSPMPAMNTMAARPQMTTGGSMGALGGFGQAPGVNTNPQQPPAQANANNNFFF